MIDAARAASMDERLTDVAAEITEVETTGPLTGAHRLQRLGRFTPLLLLSTPLVATDADLSVLTRVVVVGGTLLCLGAAAVIPWRRLPRNAQGYSLFVPIIIVVIVMTEDISLNSPFAWLELLPIVWLSLYESRRILLMGLALVAAAFGVAFASNPSLEALPGLLPPILLSLIFPGLQKLAADSRTSVLTQADRANHDPLTGLLNRRGLSQVADDNGPSADIEAAAIYIDVDHFKELNDSLGHEAGDDLLKQVGARLAASVRSEDLVARMGGDEFLVIANGNPAAIKRIRDRIDRLANTELYEIGDRSIAMTLSVGISTTQHPYDLATLIQDADHAMLDAKDLRHGRQGRTPVHT